MPTFNDAYWYKTHLLRVQQEFMSIIQDAKTGIQVGTDLTKHKFTLTEVYAIIDEAIERTKHSQDD